MPQKALKPVPEGMHTITAHLWFNGNCNTAIDFYKKVFGAQLSALPVPTPEGKGIMQAMQKLGDSNIMMADAFREHWEQGPKQSTSASLWLYVEDCDTLYNRVVEAGCEVVEVMMDAFWGDRNGKVKDSFGHCWSIASNK